MSTKTKFYAIPIKTDKDKIKISGLEILRISEKMQNLIRSLLKKKIIRIKAFSQILESLNYPIIYGRHNFESRDWLYLDLREVDREEFIWVFKRNLRRWFEKYLDNTDIKERIKEILVEIEKIELCQEDISFASNPYQVKNNAHFLYNLLPKYLAHLLDSEFKIKSDSEDKMNFDFYKLKSSNAEMVNMPIINKPEPWTYSLELSIRTIPGEKYPLLVPNLKTTRFKNKIPFVRKNKDLTVYAYRKNNKRADIIGLNLKRNAKKNIWQWKNEFKHGFIAQDNWLKKELQLEESYKRNEKLLKANSKKRESFQGAGVLYGSHITNKHRVNAGNNMIDNELVFEKLLELLQNAKKIKESFNLNYNDFYQLPNKNDVDNKKDIFKGIQGSSKFRFEQLKNRAQAGKIKINICYNDVNWLKEVKKRFCQILSKNNSSSKNYASLELENQKEFLASKAKDKLVVKYNQEKLEISFNYINASKNRDKFCFKKGEQEAFINYLRELLKPILQDESDKDRNRLLLFELEAREEFEFNDLVDPKALIREFLARNNCLTQFITPLKKESDSSLEMRFINGIRDLLRQCGLLGASINSAQEKTIAKKQVILGLWLYSNRNAGIKLPIITLINDNQVKIPISKDIIENYKKREYNLEWFSYEQGLLKLREMLSSLIKAKQLQEKVINYYIEQVLKSFSEEAIVFVNSQNIRHFIKSFQNTRVKDGVLKIEELELDFTQPPYKDFTFIRTVSGKRRETPNWVHLNETGEIDDSLREGISKINDFSYYLINNKSDSQRGRSKISKKKKLEKGRDDKTVNNALEVNILNANEKEEYLALTRLLRKQSFSLSSGQPLKFPLPLHLAKSGEEYLDAFINADI